MQVISVSSESKK